MLRRLLTAMLLAAALLALPGPPAQAQELSVRRSATAPETRERQASEKIDAQERKGAAPDNAMALPPDAVTSHTLTLGARELAYSATAGTLALSSESGERTAEIFYTAYMLEGADRATRPITFVFNGGPGAASAYLHVGALGPRVLDYGSGRELPFTSGRVVDNPDTWLDLTDLVFIDPVDTGFSRPARSDGAKEFLGVRQDLDAMAEIIRVMLGHLDRTTAPLYLVGESYGGFRAARLPRVLGSHGLVVRGAVLISPALEFALLGRDRLNPMPWVVRLPSYAAVAMEAEGKLSPATLKEAERFALGDYLAGLATPPADAAAADSFYQRIADMIGVPEPVVARWRGRVPLNVFVKEFRHGKEALVSRYDGSVAAPDPYPSSYSSDGTDPILDGITGPLTAGFVAYARDELKFKTDRRYLLLNHEVERHWDWKDDSNGSRSFSGASASDDLREGLALDPRLRILIAHGMTDLQTAYLGSRYVIDQLPPELTRDRVKLTLYPGGHMMYLRPESRAALHQDARAIYGAVE